MKTSIENIIHYFEIFIGGYSASYILFYIFLMVTAYIGIRRYVRSRGFLPSEVIIKAKYTTGVSVIAPAYNESATIVHNVKSLLSLVYPKYEVIIINDGSTDNTLEKLIKEFSLVKVPFYYQEQIKTQPVRGHYKSTDPIFSKLLVVDKENGKSKADASNAGINSSQYPLFICTDVDCILKRDTITKLIKPFVEFEGKKRVIATGAPIRISNSCEVHEGYLEEVRLPKGWGSRFQELEYIRSFLIGRMAWSRINGLLLVSGGLGMFDKEVAIAAGGYWHKSFGEDMELITRMRKYMYETKQPFLIKYIPESLCWTEVPATLKVFIRQRTRWAKGLIQTLYIHRKLILNPRYGRTGLVIFPYYLAFEFFVPIIELLGVLVIISGFFLITIDYVFLFWLSLCVYLFYVFVGLLSILMEELLYKSYSRPKEIFQLCLMVFIEPFVYHPINVYAYLKGYWYFLRKKELKWGNMQRKGFAYKPRK